MTNEMKHNCPDCPAFAKHCPHKVDGDPYYYNCQMTVDLLEKENAELETLVLGARHERDLIFDSWHKDVADLKKENEELKANLLQERETYWSKGFNYSKDKLTNAKEIIRDLLSLKSTVSSAEDVRKRFSVRERAEDFLKENEI